MDIQFHEGDLPEGLAFPDGAAVDTESMGLAVARDRLCLAQVSAGDETVHLVRFRIGKLSGAPPKGAPRRSLAL